MIMITHSKNNGTRVATTESVADILERELDPLIHDWMQLVEKQDDLMAITLGYEDRTGHLPRLLRDVITRLRLDAGTKAPISVAASHHGDLRRKQGYSVAIADEVDAQLKQQMLRYMAANAVGEFRPINSQARPL
jgi:hypothetical protein